MPDSRSPKIVNSTVSRKIVRIDSGPPKKFSHPHWPAVPALNGATSGASAPLIGQDIDVETSGAGAKFGASSSQATSTGADKCGASVSTTAGGYADGLALYEDDTSSLPTLASFLRSSTIPGPEDKEVTKLGTLLGVYLPTIQHILGVQMFLRLLWIVGIGGITESFGMVFICCLCTFLTCISISAIATNGVVESGGAYFLISRNLGPEFGTAVGMLYYLANAVAVSMYLIGGVEILLIFMFPDLPQIRSAGGHGDSAMFHNFRMYATALLIVETFIVSLGVKFVQWFAPVSLLCVVVSIFSVFIGAGVASAARSPMICLLNGRLLKPAAFTDLNGTTHCHNSNLGLLSQSYCASNRSGEICGNFSGNKVEWTPGIPGFSSRLFERNARSAYMLADEAAPGLIGNPQFEVVQDIASNFCVIMAIFFPSVTGIFTGANMSGNLKNPQKSLPIGTIAAQVTTSVVYFSFVFIFGGTIHGALLRDKYGESLNKKMIVSALAWPHHWVLLIGSFTSTFGAALQCLCSAPRLLQSMARDDVIPFLRTFSQVSKRHEPIRALILTFLIAEVGILIGSIDDVAPIVDFFFLMCYAFINVVCVLQTLLNAPNWRPRFKFYHWSLSLLGAVLCLGIMFFTYWYYALVVIILCASVYKYVQYKGAKKEWGDGIRGLALSTAHYSLLKLEDNKQQHPKNWRPQLLVMVKPAESEWFIAEKLLQVAGQLKAGQGLTIVASLITGDLTSAKDRQKAEKLNVKLQASLKRAKVRGFSQVLICQNLSECYSSFVQSVGIGCLRPNTVMVGWPNRWKNARLVNKNYNAFLDAIHRAATAGMCLLVPKGLPAFPDESARLVEGTIDVWWIIHDGGLLMVLPFLLKKHKVWRQCKLRIFAVAQVQDNSIKMKQDLQKWVYELRIDASVDVVELSDNTISAYTYEKTLLMEDRIRLAMDLHLSLQDIQHEPQFLIDRHRSRVAVSDTLKDSAGRQLRTQSSVDPASTAAAPLSVPALRPTFTSTPTAPMLDSSTGSKSPPNVLSSKSTPQSKNPCVVPLKVPTSAEGGPLATGQGLAKFFQGSPKTSTTIEPQQSPSVKQHGNPLTPKKSKFQQLGVEPDEESSLSSSDDEDADGSEEGVATLSRSNISSAIKSHLKAEKSLETQSPFDVPSSSQQNNPKITDGNATSSQDLYAKLDHRNVRKMNAAVTLNKVISEKSGKAHLVVLNLPRPPKNSQGLVNYMHYLEALTEGLDRILLVRGSGKEVITMYS